MLDIMTVIRFAFFYFTQVQNSKSTLNVYSTFMTWFDCLVLCFFLQLECVSCGNSWYASRDEVSSLTIDGSDSKKSIGTAPWATAKFEVIQKKLLSPRESENSANDISGKTNESGIAVNDTQKPIGMPKKDENVEATHAD